jgi:hypothetical protein
VSHAPRYADLRGASQRCCKKPSASSGHLVSLGSLSASQARQDRFDHGHLTSGTSLGRDSMDFMHPQRNANAAGRGAQAEDQVRRRRKVNGLGRHWCAALAIFSLQATFGFASENDNCIEPANFAWVQMDGIPTGPPGPDLANEATFTPNGQTLLMNQGDRVVVSMRDTSTGFHVNVRDATTGAEGHMDASEANGFRHIIWDPTNFTCAGEPYAFHPMYSTASPPDASGQPRT